MKFRRYDRGIRELERRLRSERPTAPQALYARYEERPVRRTRVQLAFTTVLSAVMLIALSAVGGISYAATAVSHAVAVAKKAVAPAKQSQPIVVRGISSGGDEYRPGYGFGDPNHNHTGPPGVKAGSGEKAPPIQARRAGAARIVSTTITLDEQAHLSINVVDAHGNKLLLTQESARGGSSIGGNKVTGPQTKVIQYAVLVPRAIPITLRIPARLLKAGEVYRIRIIAIDPQGNKTETLIPFRA